MSDHSLNVTPETLARLAELRKAAKFHRENFYPGAMSEGERLIAQHFVNDMLDRLQSALNPASRKAFVMAEFLKMLRHFEQWDSEEREQVCTYCERVMDILGIQSSDGLLNQWLYGFDPDKRPKRSPESPDETKPECDE
jgi:Domain of unknown function (DUF4844)